MYYYNKEIDEIEKELNTTDKGLDIEEANQRIKQYGLNELPKKKKESIIKIFFSEFKDPIVLLLLISIVASFVVGEIVDAFAIIFIVLVDIIMGTYQENKAKKTIESLDKLITENSKVKRNNQIIEINSIYLTPGDYVILESGDKVPADLRIIESYNLIVDESILTGESIQISKNATTISKTNAVLPEQTNMLFAGTSIVKGRCTAIVTKTGINTELGKIASSINETTEEKSPLTIRVEKFSKQISILILLIAIIITILLINKGMSFQQVFLSVIALAVSAMPEGLPLALTMALTIASNKMAKKNVIIRKLNSVESLGSCTIIASDKTGTLTVNEQTAKRIVLPNDEVYNISGVGYDCKGKVEGSNLYLAQELALLGVLNNEAILTKEKRMGDSIDLAFLVLGEKMHTNTNNIKILETIPYESENKFSAVFYEKDSEIYCTVKGSIEKVKEFCSDINLIKQNDFKRLEQQNEELAKEGYRVIAMANGKVISKDSYKISDIKNLTFMGLVGFIDPIRDECINAIKECHNAGIKVLMITGDHPLTAFSIAKDLELTNDFEEVTTGQIVEEYYNKGEKTFDQFVKTKKVFTRVTPLQKLQIVESLKRNKEFVAVTGDGVNDAPALKSANIGIAMGSGTDIARETADMIVLDDNFKSIVRGVKEGRIAYANIRKIILFLISCGLAEVLFFCLSIMFNMPMPLVAIQLLWLNVVTDGIQDLSLSFEKGEKNIMKQPPRSPSEPLFDKNLSKEIVLSGLTIGLVVFGIWYYLININNMDINKARGYIMALMVFIQNIHVFNCRSEYDSIVNISLNSNKLMIGGIIISISLQIIVMEISYFSKILKTVKIPINHLGYLLAISSIILIVMEVYKIAIRRKVKSI